MGCDADQRSGGRLLRDACLVGWQHLPAYQRCLVSLRVTWPRLSSATAVIMAILFFGSLVRSAFGFGEALVSVPLLALVMPVEQAAPAAVLVSVTIALIVLLQDWRKVHFQSAQRLIVSPFFGLPVGLWLLRTLPDRSVKATLAIVIIAFSIDALFN